jgi:hypothetical protein
MDPELKLSLTIWPGVGEIPVWVPKPVTLAALSLEVPATDRHSQQLLQRLISDDRMQTVWKELYRRKRPSEDYFNPAIVRPKSIANWLRAQARDLASSTDKRDQMDAKANEVEAAGYVRDPEPPPYLSDEQDEGVFRFFRLVYGTALDAEPIYRSDLEQKAKELNAAFSSLSDLSERLARLDESKLSKRVRRTAEDVAFLAISTSPSVDDFGVLIRRSKDDQLRALITDLAKCAIVLFRKELYGTIATIGNVVLERTDLTGSKVREMLRSNSG